MGLRTQLKSKAKKAAKRVLNKVNPNGDTPVSSGFSGLHSSPSPTVNEAVPPLSTEPPAAEVSAAETAPAPAAMKPARVEPDSPPVSDEEESLASPEPSSDEYAVEHSSDESAVERSEESGAAVSLSESTQLKEKIVEQIKTIFDPEIPVNIYELGLIYEVEVTEGAAAVTMTLTSPNCPAAQSLPEEVKVKAMEVDGIQDANVEIVWEPVWGPHLMTEAARLELNL